MNESGPRHGHQVPEVSAVRRIWAARPLATPASCFGDVRRGWVTTMKLEFGDVERAAAELDSAEFRRVRACEQVAPLREFALDSCRGVVGLGA